MNINNKLNNTPNAIPVDENPITHPDLNAI